MTSYQLNRFNSFFMGAAAVILPAVWCVFVRKHRKVYCSSVVTIALVTHWAVLMEVSFLTGARVENVSGL